MCGPAYTVHYATARRPADTVGGHLDGVIAGHVIVMDVDGIDRAEWSNTLTAVSQRIDAENVIGGVCRDLSRALGCRYPVDSNMLAGISLAQARAAAGYHTLRRTRTSQQGTTR